MKIFSQREWKGIARKCPYNLDEQTSQIEINTEPGKGELKRLNSRSQYLDDPLDAPAIKFKNIFSCIETVNAVGDTLDFNLFDADFYDGRHEIALCFRPRNYFELKETFDYVGILMNNTFRVYVAASNVLKLNAKDNRNNHVQLTLSAVLDEDTWYWLSVCSLDGTSFYTNLYKNGSDTASYTNTDAFDRESADYFENTGGPIRLGGYHVSASEHYPSCVSIAYFGYKYGDGASTDGDPTITPWTPEIMEYSGAK